jgi:hypothetical protein
MPCVGAERRTYLVCDGGRLRVEVAVSGRIWQMGPSRSGRVRPFQTLSKIQGVFHAQDHPLGGVYLGIPGILRVGDVAAPLWARGVNGSERTSALTTS